MSAHAVPYDFGEAKAAIERATLSQLNGEETVRDAFRKYGEAERAYRVALAKRIVELHAEGAAWTVCQDLARGDQKIAELRYLRDVAEGVREAAQSAVWRHTANRRELEQLVDWSMRVAPDGQMREPVRRAA